MGYLWYGHGLEFRNGLHRPQEWAIVQACARIQAWTRVQAWDRVQAWV